MTTVNGPYNYSWVFLVFLAVIFILRYFILLMIAMTVLIMHFI